MLERFVAPQPRAYAVEGFAELSRLELEDLGLPGVGSDLVFNGRVLIVELSALHFELAGLYLQQLGLLSCEFLLVSHLALNGTDFLRLLAESADREDGSDDGPDGQDRGGYGRDLARQVH
jgi:hypothetical protein